MPPRDPRLCPALERALPRDDLDASDPASEYSSVFEPWQFLFGDGEWHPVSVRAWWIDRHGRDVVQIEWSAGGGYWQESYRVDHSRMEQTAGDDVRHTRPGSSGEILGKTSGAGDAE